MRLARKAARLVYYSVERFGRAATVQLLKAVRQGAHFPVLVTIPHATSYYLSQEIPLERLLTSI